MRKSTSGFTIVELILVIIVIAILAAITLIGFNGIRDRAAEAQKAAIAETVQKSLENFFTLNDRYPGSGSLSSEANLQLLGLHQTDVVPAGCPSYNGIQAGWPDASTCYFTYLATTNPDGSGFQCNDPTICRSCYLSYWSTTQNKTITIRGGR